MLKGVVVRLSVPTRAMIPPMMSAITASVIFAERPARWVSAQLVANSRNGASRSAMTKAPNSKVINVGRSLGPPPIERTIHAMSANPAPANSAGPSILSTIRILAASTEPTNKGNSSYARLVPPIA